MNKPTLYERLRTAEMHDIHMEDRIKEFNQDMKEFENIHGYQDISIKEIPELDIDNYQRSLIIEYRDNEYLDNAISGTIPLKKTFEELSKNFTGIRGFFPKLKDEEHNKKVETLSELIPHTENLVTKGVFNPDNLTTGAAYGFAVGLAVAFAVPLATPLVSNNPVNLVEEVSKFVKDAKPFIGFLSVGGSALGGFSSGLLNLNVLRNQACYIDRKIEKLM